MAAAVVVEGIDNDNSTPFLRQRWWRRVYNNRHLFPTTATIFSELGGAVGDLGTYIPIALALTLVSHLDLGTTLIFTAFYNIATGFLFRLPIPVQPMKSIAAVAISDHLTLPQLLAGGLSTAAVLFLLGATGLISTLYIFIPLPVIRGVQLSQGLSFAITAVKYILIQQHFSTGKPGPPRPWLTADGILVASSAALFILILAGSGHLPPGTDDDPVEDRTRSRSRRLKLFSKIPAALVVFLFGVAISIIRNPTAFHHLHLGPSEIRVVRIPWEDWKVGFFRAAVPQIPLSILNSVIAVCKLSGDLFPGREVSARAMAVSVGAMNMVGCWVGAMPVCHGAGGLAGQYRFGGRSGMSVVLLGVAKMAVGVVLGNSFVRIMEGFPVGILGVLLMFAGVELGMACRDMKKTDEVFVMLVCAAVSMTSASGAALGFGCGVMVHLLLRVRETEFLFSLPRALNFRPKTPPEPDL